MAQAIVEKERKLQVNVNADEEYVYVMNGDRSAAFGTSAVPNGNANSGDLISSEEQVDAPGAPSILPNLYPHSFSFEEAPSSSTSIPFMPLDASTEITKHGGYSEAVEKAQKFLGSRLDSYSMYQGMTPKRLQNSALLTPRRPVYVPHPSQQQPASKETPCSPEKSFVKVLSVPKPAEFDKDLGLGWKEVPSIDQPSRIQLRKLEEEGVLYTPHDLAYSVKYLQPVAPYGDCLFLSMEQIILHADGCSPLTPMQIRHQAAKSFWSYYTKSTEEEKGKIDETIRNLYQPDLTKGWGVCKVQAHRFVASCKDRDLLFAKALTLQDQGKSWNEAARIVYSELAHPVVDARTYCRYIMVGKPERNEAANQDYLVTLYYSKAGLMSIDTDPDSTRVSWGDDIVLESLATAYNRDIFVVLVGGGHMFFLPHRPRVCPEKDSGTESLGLPPWFLIMRATGGDRGGDHYEPMICQRLRGDASPSLGSIGD